MGFYKVPLRLESLKEVVRQILMTWTTIKWEIAMHARTQIKELIFNVRSLTKLQLWGPKTWVLSHSLATRPWTSHFSSLCLFPHKCREIHHNGHVQPCFFYHVVLVFQPLSHVWLFATHGLQHTRLLCPPLFPRVCSNSCPLSQWYYITISSSAASFSFCLQSFPASNELALRI